MAALRWLCFTPSTSQCVRKGSGQVGTCYLDNRQEKTVVKSRKKPCLSWLGLSTSWPPPFLHLSNGNEGNVPESERSCED